jgi:hypothetical protein
MAQAGSSYEAILKHYYAGIGLSRPGPEAAPERTAFFDSRGAAF